MKGLLRSFLINGAALWLVSSYLPALIISGGVKGFIIGTLALTIANWILNPLIRILFLPLNLLTLGIFAWLSNVVALYILAMLIPSVKIMPYFFQGAQLNGFVIPATNLTAFEVAAVASIILGVIIHFVNWLIH